MANKDEGKDIALVEEGKKLGTSIVVSPIERMKYSLSLLEIQEQFIQKALKQGLGKDFAIIPGTQKPTLLKPGAEKLNSLFDLHPEFEELERNEDWEKNIFFYRYRCRLYNKATGQECGQGIASCNSMESKYRWRWLWGNEVPADMDKASLMLKEFTSHKTGKKYKKYRVPNPDPADQVNTIDKMAQKRAYVAATLIATQTSGRFTQDMEDIGSFKNGETINAEFEEVPNKPKEKPKPESPNGKSDVISGNEYGDMISLANEAGITPQSLFIHCKELHRITSLPKTPKNLLPEILDWIKEQGEKKELDK